LGFFFFVLAFAGLMSLIFNGGIKFYEETMKAGGFIGSSIVDILLYFFNTAGTSIILIVIFIVTLISLVEFSLVYVAQRVSRSAIKLIAFGKSRLSALANFVLKT